MFWLPKCTMIYAIEFVNRMFKIEHTGKDTGVCFNSVRDIAPNMADDVESNASAPTQGTAPSESRPVTVSQGGEARDAFFQRMNEWFDEFVRTNRVAQHPLPPPNPQSVLVTSQGVELLILNKPLVDKIRKQRAKKFRANVDDDPKRAEFWLENFIRIFDELSCTPDECLKCAISLLRDSAYQWWNTLVSVRLSCSRDSKMGQMGISYYHFIRDCPEMAEKDKFQNAILSNTVTRGRPPRNTRNGTNSRGVVKDLTARLEVRAPARTYAILAREYASSPDIEPDESGKLPIVILSMSTQKYVRKGCEAYLAGLCYEIRVLVLYVLPVAEYIGIYCGYLIACVSSTV
ncbi:Chaperone surA [Gossypium arboreum]|uniref:Chaperone surA n=1 Tax=Gossypium arboreum TaxID=29729 RepID=A0A0B0MXC0_GOSAR|nr:Chaperone surA [Gossypium arboreum]